MSEKTVAELQTLEAKQQSAIDGFANFTNKVGVNAGGNNQLSQSTYVFNFLTKNRIQLEAMYRGSWVVGKGIDTIADDMTRAGATIKTNDGAEELQYVNAGISSLRIFDSLNYLTKWGNLYGGAIGVFLIEGQDYASPLNIDRVARGAFKGIKVFDRWQVNPDLTNLIKDGVDMGLPEYYTLISSSTNMAGMVDVMGGPNVNEIADGVKIHHSRVIRATGIDLPFYQAIIEMMWGESVLERVFDRLVAFDNATMSTANLINHANLTNVSIESLREIVSVGGKAQEGLLAQFDMMRYMRSNEGITLVDKNDEVTSTSYSFAGLDAVLLQFGQHLSGAFGIPLVKMFGQSPAGLSATGESDIRNYYDEINAKQESKYRPGFEKILKLIYKSHLGKDAPKDLQFTFTPLWQISDTEKAVIGKSNAEAISGVFTSGLISRSMALKELKHQSAETGLFSNITDEDIAEAESADDFEPPPILKEEDAPKPKEKATDSIKKLLKKIVGKK